MLTPEGWMTAQVFIKLSSKLAVEKGVIDDLDGTMDSVHGTSSNAIDPKDALLHDADKPCLSRSTRRTSWAQEKLQSGSREESKKRSNGRSTSSTM
jgi:hypothetical protein